MSRTALMLSLDEIERLLSSGHTPSIRKAAKNISKYNISTFGETLQHVLRQILSNPKLWETQVDVIKALGIIDYKPALAEVTALCVANKEFDMVTYSAATAYVRLKRNGLHDATAVFELLKQKGYAVTCGGLDALGYDRMMPHESDISRLLEICRDLRSPNPRGLSDPRYGLAAACAGWDPDIVRDFLMDCVNTGDAPLKYVTENSLKGKYVKLR